MKTGEVILGGLKESQNSTKPEIPNLKSIKSDEVEDISANSPSDKGEIEKITKWLRKAVNRNKARSIKGPAENKSASDGVISIINKVIFPSTDQVEKLAAVILPGTVAVSAAAVFARPEIVPFIYTVGVTPLIAELVFQHKNTIKINDLMSVIKAVNGKPKKFANGEEIKNGHFVGELHIEGANVRKKWRKLSPEIRGKALIEAALDGFIKLGNRCQANDPSLTGVEIFQGKSDLVKPRLFKRFGFEEVENEEQPSNLHRFFIRVKRIAALGVVQGLKAPIRDINTVWITRNNLIKALPQLIEQHKLIAPGR